MGTSAAKVISFGELLKKKEIQKSNARVTSIHYPKMSETVRKQSADALSNDD